MTQAQTAQAPTSPTLDVTDRARIRRHPERGTGDRSTIVQILDEGLVCHVGLIQETGDSEQATPLVIPMGYGRWRDELVLHGSPGSRLMRSLAGGAPACVTVTLLDGLVLARSAFHSSMNYRSVVLFGRFRALDDPAEKREALDAVVEHLLPGRVAEARPMTDQEVAGTLVVALPIREGMAKVRTGPPKEAEADIDYPVWAGVVPILTTLGEPEPAPNLGDGFAPSFDVATWRDVNGT